MQQKILLYLSFSGDYIRSDVYHVLSMCLVYIKVKIKSSESDCFIPYFFETAAYNMP
jgi:hypothetical protein